MTIKKKILEIIQQRKKPIAILIGIVIVISIIGIVFTSSILNDEDELIAIAHTDNNIVRTNEVINFNSEESKGDIKSLTWNFSDGNESNEQNPTHSFEVSGWYEVTLLIRGANGKWANTSINIGVQHEDTEAERTVGRWFVLDPSARSGPAYSVLVGPNIANPTVTVSIALERPFGTFLFIVDVAYWGLTDDMQNLDIYTETVTLTGGTYLFEYTVDPTDLPDEVSDGHALVNAVAQIDEGKCQGATFTLTSIFPIENISN